MIKQKVSELRFAYKRFISRNLLILGSDYCFRSDRNRARSKKGDNTLRAIPIPMAKTSTNRRSINQLKLPDSGNNGFGPVNNHLFP